MRPPSTELREHVGAIWIAQDISPVQREELLDDVLTSVLSELRDAVGNLDVRLSEEESMVELAAVDAWAGLVSYVVARTYAPASPWPSLPKAGWSQQITQRLQQVAASLRRPLLRVKDGLHAAHVSVSVGFPWGVSVGVSF